MRKSDIGKETIYYLISIMVAVSFIIVSIAIGILYFVSFKQQRLRLIETAQSQARLIESVAKFDAQYSLHDHSGGAFGATLSQIVEAHENYKGFGVTGEFTLAMLEGNQIVFLLSHRHFDLDKPKPVPFDSDIAEPIRRALKGESGSIVGLDYRGKEVLAAFEPVNWSDHKIGIVAKIDLSEIRSPFARAGLVTALLAIIIIGFGVVAFKRLAAPYTATALSAPFDETLKITKTDYWCIAVCVFLAAAVFFLDILTQTGVAEGVPYIALVLISLWSAKRYFTVAVGILCTILTMTGFFMSPAGGDISMALIHRFLAISAIWITAILTLHFKEAGRKAIENARKLEEAQRIAHIGSWEWNIETNEIIRSEEIYRILGRTQLAFNTTSEAFFNTIHPDDRETVIEAVDESVKDNAAYDIEYRIVRPDNEERVVHEQGIVYRDDSGKPLRMIGTMHDITGRKMAESELRLAAKIFENAMEGVMVTGADAVIQSVNKSFTTITGYSASEAIGKKPNILKSNRHKKEFYEKMWESLLTTGQWQGEIWNRRKNGEAYPERLTITAIKDLEGKTVQYASIFYDITEIKQSEKEIEYKAYHDALTGLPNRQLFYDRLEQAIVRAKRAKSMFAVLFIDVDNFKSINDSLGHAAGDLLLQGIGVRLIDCAREEDTVSRLGGDEYTIIIENIANEQEAATVARRVIDSLCEPFNYKGDELHATVSIGITVFPANGETVEDLVKNADMAMYSVKDLGKNNYRFFTPEMNEKVVRRHELEKNLRKAIEKNELIAYYQPKINIKSGRIIGMEALIRWNRPGLGLVPPSEFIPIAEETGLVVELDEWMFCTVCAFAKKIKLSGLIKDHDKPLKIAVNLSAKDIEKPGLVKTLNTIVSSNEINPADIELELEVTESAIIHDIDWAIQILTCLRESGFGVSIDDFGTGYSSFNYLTKFPINTLKIDRTFIVDLEVDSNARLVAKAITAMAHELDITVVAEGVETEGQLDFLRSIGCDEMQGYLFSRPLPEEEMEKLLKEGKILSFT